MDVVEVDEQRNYRINTAGHLTERSRLEANPIELPRVLNACDPKLREIFMTGRHGWLHHQQQPTAKVKETPNFASDMAPFSKHKTWSNLYHSE